MRNYPRSWLSVKDAFWDCQNLANPLTAPGFVPELPGLPFPKQIVDGSNARHDECQQSVHGRWNHASKTIRNTWELLKELLYRHFLHPQSTRRQGRAPAAKAGGITMK